MVRRGGWLVFFLTLTTALPARAEPPGAGPHAQTIVDVDKVRQAKIAAHIAIGDRERRAGRFPEAAQAYADALELGDNPLVGGRLGVLLVKLGNPVLGADYLLDAIDRASSASKSERIEFLEAYDAAKAQVCRVTVSVSEAHAVILLNGNVKQPDGITGFTMFVEAGEHELRGNLKGFHDAVVNFAANKGTEMRLHLAFEPKVAALPQLPTPITPPGPPRNFPAMMRTTNIATDPNYSTNEDPFYEPPKPQKKEEKRGPRFSVNAGIVTVFGVASWNPAVGGVVGIGLKANEYFSFGLEGRAAWLTTDVADIQGIGAMTAGGLLSACGRLRWFVGCGLGYYGTVNIKTSGRSYLDDTISYMQPGFGGRLGVELPLGTSFFASANIDALRLIYRTRVGIGGIIIVDQPPALLSAQLTGGWRF